MRRSTGKPSEVAVDIEPASPPAGHRFQSLIPAILLVLITLGVFQSIRSYEFTSWDDRVNILQNEHLNRPGGPDFGFYWREPFLFTYRPLIYTAWSFIAAHSRLEPSQISPDSDGCPFDPHAYHTANWIMHAINALLAFFILRILVRKDWPAFAGALLFAVHPFQDESVAWVTGGNELLYGFFALLALWQYLLFAIKREPEPTPTRLAAGTGRPAKRAPTPRGNGYAPSRDGAGAVTDAFISRLHYIASCLFFVLALLTKPTAACLPLVAAVLDIWVVRRRPVKALVALAPWLVAAAAWVPVTAWARTADTQVDQIALWPRPFVAGDALAFYLYKLMLPINMGIDYGHNPESAMTHWWFYLTFLVPVAVGVIVWKYRRAAPLLLVAFAIFLVTLLPTIGLVPTEFQSYSTVADRYMYLAMLGPAIAMAWLLARVDWEQTSGMVAAAACSLFLAASATMAFIHARDFRNDGAVYGHAIAVNPQSWVSEYNLGRYLADHGNLVGAANHLRAAVTIAPDFADGFNNLAVTLDALGREQDAIAALQKAVGADPGNASYRVNMAQVYERMGRAADAASAYEAALQSGPDDPDTEFHLGMDLLGAGKLADAATHLQQSLAMNPNNAVAENHLGVALARLGRVTNALPHWQKAIQLQPDYASAHYNYGAALDKLGRTQEAIIEYEASVRLAPQSALARNALARVMPSAGKK
jgi:tetratricopeptide (TPR) repeat protein